MSHKYDGGNELIDKDETHKHENIDLFRKDILQQ